MFELRPVGYIIGLMTAVLGLFMLFPMVIDLASGHANWRAFAAASAVTTTTGIFVALACADSEHRRGLDLRQSFVLTAATWAVLAGFGAIPFMLGAPGASLTDAVFESMSGLTTTGTTVFEGLDELPPGTNLWRALLNWLGGLGIVIVALIFLPVMKIGGMQFFRAEGFDTLGKVLPRAFDISVALVQIYVAMTLICALAYRMLGMDGFEAVIHALSSTSTGGFSNRDASFADFTPSMHLVAIVAMILSTLPFIRFIQLVSGDVKPIWRDIQIRAYLRWLAYAVALVTIWRVVKLDQPWDQSLLDAGFNVVSVFSGTGYSTGDLAQWDHLPFVVLMIAGFIGGCTSSTGCSVKVFRYLVMFEAIRTQIRRILMPATVQPLRLDGRPVEPDVVSSVITFVTLFVVTFGVLAVGLSMTGLAPRTALTAAWSAIADIGPVFGPEVSSSGAVGAFPASAKWIMTVGMMLGRLELLGVFVLFTARFWSR